MIEIDDKIEALLTNSYDASEAGMYLANFIKEKHDDDYMCDFIMSMIMQLDKDEDRLWVTNIPKHHLPNKDNR